MANYTEYFNKIGYKGTYSIGDRVFGKWNKIPFVGSVGNDTLVNHQEGPYVTVSLDLPLKYNDVVYSVIKVKHKDIKPLKVL